MEQSTRYFRKLKRVVIKEELVALTGDVLDAIILDKFIDWTDSMYGLDELLEEKQKNSQTNSEDQNNFLEGVKTKGWICKNASWITDELLLAVTKETLRNHLFALTQEQKDKKENITRIPLLEERNNPTNKWDKTLQYRIKIREIDSELKRLGYPGGIDSVVLEDKKGNSEDSSPKRNSFVSEQRTYVPNNISNNILHYISSSSENKFSSADIHVTEEKPSTNVSGTDTGGFQPCDKQHPTVGKGLSDESHLTPEIINSSLQKDAPCPAPDRTAPVASPNRGLLRRRVLIGLEKIKAKSIEERFINVPVKVESKSERIRAKSIEERARLKVEEEAKKEKEKKPVHISSDISEIFDYWKECGFKLRGETTKGYKNGIRKVRGLLKGTLFTDYKQPFTMEQIKTNINKFQIMAFNEDYEPVELAKKKTYQKTTLDSFIENSHAGNGNGGYFRMCHKYEPKLIKRLFPDPSPGLTKALKEIFAKEICAGRKPEKYSVHEENCFRSSVDKIIKFCTSNSRNLAIQTEREMMVYLCDCLRETCSGGTMIITPGFLCSEKTFTYRLPQYLEKQGIMYR